MSSPPFCSPLFPSHCVLVRSHRVRSPRVPSRAFSLIHFVFWSLPIQSGPIFSLLFLYLPFLSPPFVFHSAQFRSCPVCTGHLPSAPIVFRSISFQSIHFRFCHLGSGPICSNCVLVDSYLFPSRPISSEQICLCSGPFLSNRVFFHLLLSSLIPSSCTLVSSILV